MILTQPTDAELLQTFDKLVARIYAGQLSACPSDTGLDAETQAAVTAFAAGTITETDAREVFAHMLDGTNAKATQARIERQQEKT